MLLFSAEGRLGNQIFQYAFLKKIRKNNEKIIISGFEELLEVFDIDDIINLNKKNRWIRILLSKLIEPMLIFLSKREIISSISISYEKILDIYQRENTTYEIKKGFISNLIFINTAYFQSEDFFDSQIISSLKIKEKYYFESNLFLSKIQDVREKVVIHIRRGDYSTVYSVYGKSALLPIDFFKERIEWFQDNIKNPFFIFLSDDTEFIEKEFSYIKDKLISVNNDFGTDLAIMTQCSNAILSPSTFGWWGTYLMPKKGIVFTPKYWTGFNSKIECHKNSNLSFAIKIEVKL